MKRVYRSRKERMPGGICGGIAGYTGADPGIVRPAFGVVRIRSLGLAILVYIAAWFFVPEPAEASAEPATGTAV